MSMNTNPNIETSRECECCGKIPENNSLIVVGSSLGAFSIAYCEPCLKHEAEPVWAVEATIEIVGGLDSLADWVKERVKVPLNGYYATVQQYLDSKVG